MGTTKTKARRITRWGIGPKFALPSLLYGIFGAYLTYKYPEHLRIAVAPSWATVACGTGILVAGIVIYAMSLRLLNENMKRGCLVTTGPYGVVRHPVYAAWILLIVPGLALVFGSWPLVTAPAVCYASFKIFIHEEEDALESMFDNAYTGYRSNVPELFPAFWTLRKQRQSERKQDSPPDN